MIFLLPNILSDVSELPIGLGKIVEKLDGLIAESEKEGRRYLLHFLDHNRTNALPLYLLNEHTKNPKELIPPLGKTYGLISDKGMPCIGDPGSDLVFLARKEGVAVKALPGPSSILLAFVLSGFDIPFCFHGYLPREEEPLKKLLQKFEKEKMTHIWIEAPYRFLRMMQILIATLDKKTTLCVAENLLTAEERVRTLPISLWEKEPLQKKSLAVFLLSKR